MSKRAEILVAAYDILGKDGLEGLHARTVAAAVEVNHAAVHYYFPRRTDLLLAVLEYANERFIADRLKVAKNSKKGVTAETDLALFESYGKGSGKFFRIWASFYVASQSDPLVSAKLAECWQSWSVPPTQNASGKKSKKATGLADPQFILAVALGAGIMANATGEKAFVGKAFAALLKEVK